jgi:RHS repeat-associated protein
MDLGFTGHKWDAETGNHYAPYRYLMSGYARWLSRDPLGMVDGPNLYGYVNKNPINYSDPFGLKADAFSRWAACMDPDGFASISVPPPGFSLPFGVQPKLSWQWRNRKFQSRWTSGFQRVRTSLPMSRKAARRALQFASKRLAVPLTLVDGALSWSRIIGCMK